MIDVLLGVVLLAYLISGYRQGLVLGALAIGGFLGGAVLGVTVAPGVAERVPAGVARSLVVLAAVLLFAWLGQLVGSLLGGRLRDAALLRPVRLVDQVLGAAAAVTAVALVAWFVGGALRSSPSPTLARAVAGSRIIGAVDAVVPEPVATLADDLRDAVVDSDVPRVFAGITPEQIEDVDPPDDGAVPTSVLTSVRRGIVKVTGDAEACGRSVEGSGAVVAHNRVVTNAHVVAGMSEPRVQVGGEGDLYEARVVLFDPQRDLAVLAVPGLDATTLDLGDDLSRGDQAAVVGFPRNGGYTSEPARVRSVLQASGEDIYGDEGAVREVYSLYATVEPGNSGGPLVSPEGRVVGIVFAKSLDDGDTGYALTMAEATDDIEAGIAAQDTVDTGECALS